MALEEFIPPNVGWCPDVADFRDRTADDEGVRKWLRRAGIGAAPGDLPRRISLREWFAPVRPASPLRDASVQAIAAIIEYFERRTTGTATPRSTRFLYCVARRLEGSRGDAGVGLRSTLKALVRFGMPPARFWPDDPAGFDVEPEPFLYGFQRDFRKLKYVRLDDPGNGAATLATVRSWLAAGIPCAFGFGVPTSLSRHADIPFRPSFDGLRCGAAAVAIGYDDDHLASTKGALRIRSVWGPEWGRRGYGWLPYAYVERGGALDFWTVATTTWVSAVRAGRA